MGLTRKKVPSVVTCEFVQDNEAGLVTAGKMGSIESRTATPPQELVEGRIGQSPLVSAESESEKEEFCACVPGTQSLWGQCWEHYKGLFSEHQRTGRRWC